MVEEKDVEKSLMNPHMKERRNYLTRLRFNVTFVKRMGILHLNFEIRKTKKKSKERI